MRGRCGYAQGCVRQIAVGILDRISESISAAARRMYVAVAAVGVERQCTERASDRIESASAEIQEDPEDPQCSRRNCPRTAMHCSADCGRNQHHQRDDAHDSEVRTLVMEQSDPGPPLAKFAAAPFLPVRLAYAIRAVAAPERAGR